MMLLCLAVREATYKVAAVSWRQVIVFVSDTDKWVCCRCVAELEASSAETTENTPLVVVTNSDSKVDGKYERLVMYTLQ